MKKERLQLNILRLMTFSQALKELVEDEIEYLQDDWVDILIEFGKPLSKEVCFGRSRKGRQGSKSRYAIIAGVRSWWSLCP